MADMFISYARDDDIAPPGIPDAKGFVTFLDEHLRYQFRDLGPHRPEIWRDNRRIPDGAQFDAAIDQALQTSRFLLVVMSPNWMARDWCRKELDTFVKYRSAEGIADVCDQIIVVCKRHIEPADRPSWLQHQVGYAFYVRSHEAGEMSVEQEFFSRGKVQDDRYWIKVEELADYVLKVTKDLTLLRTSPSPTCKPSGRTVFLAKPASDMRLAYSRLVKELTGHGHKVVPDPAEDIPLDASTLPFIDAAMNMAEFSVHLLGEKTGPVPEDQTLPIVRLQLDRAAARGASVARGEFGFHRVIWAPKVVELDEALSETKAAAAVARQPLDVLSRFNQQLPNDKIEGDSLSKFVDFLNQHLVLVTPPLAPGSLMGQDTRLYLYHSAEDTDYVLGLAEALQSRQVEAVLPAFEGPDAEIRQFHNKTLSECDAVALCWASASEVWVRAQASALRDWQGLGRTHQFAFRAVVAAPPPGQRKKAIKMLFPRSEIDLIVDLSDKPSPSPELLDQLVPPARAHAA